MSGIIKRKLRETWRDAVSARLASAAPLKVAEGLAAYDAELAQRGGEAEAAHATLSAYGLLWQVDGAGFTTAAPASAEADQRHCVPNA